MTSNCRSAHGNSNSIQLMLHSIRTFREIAKALLSSDTVAKEVKSFCRRLRVHCYLIEEPAERIHDPDHHLVQGLLTRFQSTVTSIVPETWCTPANLSAYSLLWALNCHWDSIDSHLASYQLDLITSYLNFGSTSKQQDELLNFLDSWLEEVEDKFPEDSSRWSVVDYIPQRMAKRSEPSYAVCTAAQVAHKTLLTALCTPARCQMKHEYGAQLCLGTYRHSLFNESVDFDMFLAVEQLRQETRVRTAVKRPVVTFALNDEPRQDKTRTSPGSPWRVRNLCHTILKIRSWPSSWRLKFEVQDQHLKKMASEMSSLVIDTSKAPISLQNFLDNRPKSLTEKTK
jgi:hypothetical protein